MMKKIDMQQRHHVEEPEDNIIQKVMARYLPYWPLLILFMLLSAVAAYVYLRYATPMYASSAKIIIKDERRGTDDPLIGELDVIASKKLVENELEVLQSRALMEKVVKNLRLYAPLYTEGKVKANDAYLRSPITVEARNTDSMVEAKKVSFDYDKSSRTVTLGGGKNKYPLSEYVNTPYGVLKFAPNKYYNPGAEADRKLYFALIDPKTMANYYVTNQKNGLQVISGKQSAIIELNFKDIVPERAVNILNEVIDVYVKGSIDDKNSSARTALSFVNERLAVVERELDSIERKIQSYKSGSNAVDISSQGQMALSKITENDQNLAGVNNQLAMLNDVERYVINKESAGGLVPSTGSDPMLSTLVNKLYSSELEYDKLKKTVGENNPKLLALSDEINKMRPSILENIRNQKSTLNASRQSLNATNSAYSSVFRSVPKKERDLLNISREHAIKNEIYALLLKKREESELTYASTTSMSRVVDKAMVSKEPVSPKKKMIYLMALAGALGMFIGIITVKDMFTGKIKYRSEIEKMTGIPILGEIAYDKSKSPLVIEKGTRSFVAEEFRKLRISLSFLGIDQSHKKILLTSSISGEGKSFIAANLAVSLSLTGKRVALVDLDLNNPTLSSILNVEREFGITEVLTGEKKIEEVIAETDTQSNLFFIATGNLPENPTELLANGRINNIIDYLDNNYDMVVIDTSPAVLVTDAYILSGLCDATLYVIRHGYTPKLLVKRIDDNNEINPLNNPAIIFNGVKTRGVFRNNYGYGYDYVYANKDKNRKSKKAS
jgi:tyrosine-protein kinase Etk/Wzc